MAANDQSIVIKKIKKSGHAAHGGAWKVAYADFVTAMMAFFLLLWLLNATEAEKLAGLADYFAPTVGIRGNMGIGFRGGKGALSKGIGADKSTNKGIIFAAPTAGTVVKNPEEVDLENTLPEEEKIQIVESAGVDEVLEETKDDLVKELSESSALTELLGNILIENTPEGLKIQMVDKDKKPMFDEGDIEPNENAKTILKKLTEIIDLLPNYVSITGHTYSLPLGRGLNYSNWELSADRANAVRRFFVENGIVSEQISEVVGRADQEPLDPSNPEAAVNNRIEIMLLKNAYLTKHKKGAPDEVFVDPDSAKKEALISVEHKEDEPETLQETPLPETKGRDFFEGVAGEGMEYEAGDPGKAKATVVPGGFFTKETPAEEILKDQGLFGRENQGPVEDLNEKKLKEEEAKRFNIEKIEKEAKEIEDYKTIDSTEDNGGVLPDQFFNKNVPANEIYNQELFGDQNQAPLEPVDEVFEQKQLQTEEQKKQTKEKSKKEFFEQELEQLPQGEQKDVDDLLNGGDSSFPLDFFGNLGL